jgi:ribosomal protein S18 acetylase RimI-like enzyme
VLVDNSKPETRNSKLQPPADLTFRFMREGEEKAVCDLIHRVFNISVSPLYTKKGITNFKEYAAPEEMSRRVHIDHFVLLALFGGDMVGMIEMRRNDHISLLFVAGEHQGKGIGRDLLGLAVEFCLTNKPQLKEVTVNSSPNAFDAYERMGFKPTGEEQSISGVRSIPMKKKLH